MIKHFCEEASGVCTTREAEEEDIIARCIVSH